MENCGHLYPAARPRGSPPDPLAVLRVVGELAGGNRDRVEHLEQAQLGQLARCVGQDVDPDAELLDGAGRFVHSDVVEAGVFKRQREHHAADAPAYDHNLHCRKRGWRQPGAPPQKGRRTRGMKPRATE